VRQRLAQDCSATSGPFRLETTMMTRVEALHAEMPPSSASCKHWKRSKAIRGGNMPNSEAPGLQHAAFPRLISPSPPGRLVCHRAATTRRRHAQVKEGSRLSSPDPSFLRFARGRRGRCLASFLR
jgi:hypothetical protein